MFCASLQTAAGNTRCLRGIARRTRVCTVRGARRLGIFLTGMLFGACSGAADPPGHELALDELSWTSRPADASLILIVNDTMRRDRVGIYGGPARTPAFDRFAGDNLLFDTAYTQSPWTKPAMATLFTSLYPSQHGVVSHPSIRARRGEQAGSADQQVDVLSDEFTTLAELLAAAGFTTAAFVGNPWLEKRLGFGQGFDLYDDSFAAWDVPGKAVSRAGLRWLDGRQTDERFFLYLHYMDTHRPYGRLTRAEIAERAEQRRAGAQPLAAPIAEQISRLVWLEEGISAEQAGIAPSIGVLEMAYDRGIEAFDAALDDFLATFRTHPAYSRTAVVVVSDHGEALYTRGWGNHGGGLYEDEVAIPMAVRLPGLTGNGSPVESPVGLVDLMPTLCTYLDVELPDGLPIFGRDWLGPAADGGRLADRYLVTEGVMFRPENRAIRFREYKALWQPHLRSDRKERALFNVRQDPGEGNDLLLEIGDGESTAEIFNDIIRGGHDTVPAFVAPEKRYIELDPELERRLRSLGYIQ